MASAGFEAFEHFFYKYESLPISTRTFVIGQADGAFSQSSPDFGLLFPRANELSLSCLRFQSLSHPDESIDFPAILTNPAYVPSSREEQAIIETSRIYRYSTNSGTAAGATLQEAVLHGLLELVERDAIGMAFVECVIADLPRPIRRVDLGAIEKPLREMVTLIEAESGGKVSAWDIGSDTGVPVFLARIATPDPAHLAFFGSGASLSPGYALERALLEALQGWHIQTYFGVRLQVPGRRHANRMSLFQRCGLDAGHFHYRGGETLTAIESSATDPRATGMLIGDQISQVASSLSMAGVRTYSRVVRSEFPFVAQVVAPALDRFYLISHGISVMGGARARRRHRELSAV